MARLSKDPNNNVLPFRRAEKKNKLMYTLVCLNTILIVGLYIYLFVGSV